LHATGNLRILAVLYQQVNVIAGSNVIQHREAIAFSRLEQPVLPALAIPFKLKQELPIMASMGDVPDGAWNVEAISSWHGKGQMT
jgi:hypothetical protein